MKIAIVGTHGVGKTTLAKGLSRHMAIPMLVETARDVLQEFGWHNTEAYRNQAGELDKAVVQSMMFMRQINNEYRYRSWVSDRSVLDVVAYSKAYGVPTIIVDDMERLALNHAVRTYHAIIYIPPMFEAEDDGFRLVGDEVFRYRVDQEICELLKQIEDSVPVYRVDDADYNNRLVGAMGFLLQRYIYS